MVKSSNMKSVVASEADVARLVQSDPWMMKVLRAVESLNLPDWWIGAGFLRNKVWTPLRVTNIAPPKMSIWSILMRKMATSTGCSLVVDPDWYNRHFLLSRESTVAFAEFCKNNLSGRSSIKLVFRWHQQTGHK